MNPTTVKYWRSLQPTGMYSLREWIRRKPTRAGFEFHSPPYSSSTQITRSSPGANTSIFPALSNSRASRTYSVLAKKIRSESAGMIDSECDSLNAPTGKHRRVCPLCEGMCGVEIDVVGDRAISVRSDHHNVWSKG